MVEGYKKESLSGVVSLDPGDEVGGKMVTFSVGNGFEKFLLAEHKVDAGRSFTHSASRC